MEFIVVYDELVGDCKSVERRLHERFAGQRVRDQREFFHVTPKEAILALQELSGNSPVKRVNDVVRIDLLSQFEMRCRRWLRSDLVGLALVQTSEVVYLEQSYQPTLMRGDIETERTALDFISDDIEGGRPLFDPSLPPEVNARELIGLDTNTLLHCFVIFHSEVYEWANLLEEEGERLPYYPPVSW